MLKVFHTADWHLGQSFCGYDRGYEQEAFLDWLLQQLQEARPDALAITLQAALAGTSDGLFLSC